MAWYALYKWFRPWRKTPYNHWIKWYKRELHIQWFNSLSEQEKEEYLKEIEKKKMDKENYLKTVAGVYNNIMNTLNNKTGIDWRRYL